MHFTNHNTAKFLSALSFTNHNTAKWHSCSTKPPSLHNSDLTPRYALRLFSISLRLCFDHLTLSSLSLSLQKTEDSLSLTRRAYHIEPGPREKAVSLSFSLFALLLYHCVFIVKYLLGFIIIHVKLMLDALWSMIWSN
jgi:hypothetical protein